MQIKRFFISNLKLEIDNSYNLVKEDYNYIVNVMRQKLGDQILLANNTGYDFLCDITNITKNSITISVLNKTKNASESKIHLTVCQALVKGDKFELIAQKITELGAKELIPFTSTFTIVKDNTQKIDRLIRITGQASSQCGRAKMLNINTITSLKELPKLLNDYDLVLLAYENEKNSLKSILQNTKNASKIAIIIGSEGGFSPQEIDFLESNLSNLKTVSLGARILRAETASIALTATVMYEMGEMG